MNGYVYDMIANQIFLGSDAFRKQRLKIRGGRIRKEVKSFTVNVPNEVHHGLANQMSSLSTYQSETE